MWDNRTISDELLNDQLKQGPKSNKTAVDFRVKRLEFLRVNYSKEKRRACEISFNVINQSMSGYRKAQEWKASRVFIHERREIFIKESPYLTGRTQDLEQIRPHTRCWSLPSSRRQRPIAALFCIQANLSRRKWDVPLLDDKNRLYASDSS